MARGKKKRTPKQLTDQEVLEWFLRISSGRRPLSLDKERKGLLKGTLIGIFYVGPFFTILPFIAWFGVIPLRYLGILVGINAIVLIILYGGFYFTSVRFEFNSHEQVVHFIGVWAFLYISWLGFYVSLMALLSSIGVLVLIQEILWWIPVLIYVISGIGIWLGRKRILRAIVEGPEAHAWFWPIRLLFATSLGFWVFLAAVQRIFFSWLENVSVNLGLLLIAAWALSIALLILGLSSIGVVIARLHYQRWKGVEELKA